MFRKADPYVTNCWIAQIGEGDCDCADCQPHCPVEDHQVELEKLIDQIGRTHAGIRRLRSYAIIRPDLVGFTAPPKIYKGLLLRVALRLYDCDMDSYAVPRCPCPNASIASLTLRNLFELCVIAGIDTNPMWSFLPKCPLPAMCFK